MIAPASADRARRYAAAFLCGLVGLSALPPPAYSWPEDAFGDPDARQDLLEPPLTLPEAPTGIVRPRPGASPPTRVDRIRDVFLAIEACWRLPEGSGYSGQELTLRVSFRRDGQVLGTPRITYYKPGSEPGRRDAFTRSVRDAFARCAPLPFTEGLGRAVAGRPFIFRFIDSRPI